MSASRSPLQLQGKRFEWGIRRSSFGKKGLRYSLGSPSFSFVGPDNAKSSWFLQFCCDSHDCFQYGLYLIPHDHTNPKRVDIKVKLGVIMKDGTEGHVKQCQIFTGADACGFPNFLEGYLYCFGKGHDLFWANKLTIFCDLEVGKPDFDFSRIFDSGKFTDFTLVVGEEELKVHRAVLASKSFVFEAMFEQDMKEKQSGRVEIKDVDLVGMKGLLQFIYSGEVKDLEEVAVKVFRAADKFRVVELKKMCKKMICKKSSEEEGAICWSWSKFAAKNESDAYEPNEKRIKLN